jgi:hypothetical protein
MHLPPELALETFTPHVGSLFELQGEGGEPVPLELAKATPLGSGMPGGRAPFRLLFLGPAGAGAAAQRTWPLAHAALGRLDIFLVPLGPVQGRMQYEAIFA